MEDPEMEDPEMIFKFSKMQIEKAWDEFVRLHMLPSRLMALAVGLAEPNDQEQQHLDSCRSCQEAYKRYLT